MQRGFVRIAALALAAFHAAAASAADPAPETASGPSTWFAQVFGPGEEYSPIFSPLLCT